MSDAAQPPVTMPPARRGVAVWVAAGGGLGFSPLAPGTLGSLLGIPLAAGLGLAPNVWWHAAALVAIAIAGVPICTLAVRQLGGPHDPGCIVFDEIVGMAATLFLFDATHVMTVVAAFVLFRVFDILKPTPAREVEALPHGWGIMADDLVAAVYANLSLRLLAWSAGSLFTGAPMPG
jgi:phosphatidylglycerophosphatase A